MHINARQPVVYMRSAYIWMELFFCAEERQAVVAGGGVGSPRITSAMDWSQPSLP
jgi:hypothetical protein